jgi:hypothetical protein
VFEQFFWGSIFGCAKSPIRETGQFLWLEICESKKAQKMSQKWLPQNECILRIANLADVNTILDATIC